MTTEDFITMLFCRIDDAMRGMPKHPLAALYPSELVTLGMLFALKGVGERAFDRWVRRDYRALFPHLPERTRLFRLLTQVRAWTQRFLTAPGLLSVADTYGIELLHPRRQGRSSQQLGAHPGSRLPPAHRRLGRPHRRADRQRLAWQDGRPAQYEGLPARHLEHAHAGRDGALDADHRLPPQEGGPPRGRLLPHALGFYHRCRQPARAVARPATGRTWCREALHRGV